MQVSEYGSSLSIHLKKETKKLTFSRRFAVNCQRIRDGLQPESTTTSNDFDNGHGDNHSSYGAGEVSFSNKKRRLSDGESISISLRGMGPSC